MLKDSTRSGKKKIDTILQQIYLNENGKIFLRHHRNKALGQLLYRSHHCKNHTCFKESGILTTGFIHCGCLKMLRIGLINLEHHLCF